MQCIYINLDNKTRRKELIEQSFQEHKIPGWTLTRFPANDVEYVKRANPQGSLRDTEKACFMSHRDAIRRSLGTNDHVMILEDDMVFDQNTCETIQQAFTTGAEWDIMYAEICVPNPGAMYELVKLRQDILKQNKNGFILLDPAKIGYAGATAYIIHRNSRYKVLNLLEKVKRYDVPYDLLLREFVHKGILKGTVVFPFAISFSDEALKSDIREPWEQATDLAWILYRKLVAKNRDISREQEHLGYIENNLVSEESEAFAKIFSVMLNEKFVNK